MKKNLAILLLVSLMTTLASLPVSAEPSSKQAAKISYVLKNLKLPKDKAASFKPILASYYNELHNAKASHKALKEKLSAAEDAGKLTPQQCDQLFESKQKQEMAELALRKKYYAQFKTVLSAQQAYRALKLTDDKIK